MEFSYTEPERFALIGLAHRIACADYEITRPERELLKGLARELGAPTWPKLLLEYHGAKKRPASVDEMIGIIERPEARDRVYTFLYDLSLVDTLDEEEARLLNRIAKEWGYGVK